MSASNQTAASPPATNIAYRTWQSRLTERLTILGPLLLAIGLGFAVRSARTLSADFPLNDGGLFYVMARDLQHAQYRIPALTTYNAAGIPFVYPPLGLFVAATLDALTPLSLLDIFRFLPLAGSTLTILAVYLLARSLLPTRATAGTAAIAFALTPRGYTWLLMGGGITRSLGFLFALLALHQVHAMYSRHRPAATVAATLFSALAVLSHPESAPFLALSSAALFLAFGRHRQGVSSSIVVAAGTVLLTAPWWAAAIAAHGLAPFQTAFQAGGPLAASGETRERLLLSLLQFGYTGEPFFPVIAALGLLGAVCCLATGRVLLPGWWLALVVLMNRSYPTYAAVPVALMAAIAVHEVLLPLLTRPVRVGPADDLPPAARRRRPLGLALAAAALLTYLTAAALAVRPGLTQDGSALLALTADQRAAMDWVAHETPPQSRFLIIPTTNWGTARTAEWFPALTERVSVATPQGHEWLPRSEFVRRVVAFQLALACRNDTAACLSGISRQTGLWFTYVYIDKDPEGMACCAHLVQSLDSAPDVQKVYDGPGASIYARR
jgi:hypothetical protein